MTKPSSQVFRIQLVVAFLCVALVVYFVMLGRSGVILMQSGEAAAIGLGIGIFVLPLIGLWVRMLTIPYHLLFPAIIAICCIGAFSVNNSVFDVFIMALFGVVGYTLIKLDFEPAPLLLGFVLGPMLEENLRRAMLLSRGSPMVFITHPLSLGLLVVAAALLLIVVLPSVRSKREEAFSE